MLNQASPKPPETSKDRVFGEYRNEHGHRCPCYEKSAGGPPMYAPGDVYFCFARFQNPFVKNFQSRYAALSVFMPNVDVIHKVERQEGRPLMPHEWPLIPGAMMQGFRPVKTTNKGLAVLFRKVEMWLKGNMIDEIDHRLVDAHTPEEWKLRNAELCALYGVHEWAKLGSDGKDWMKLHSATNKLEMLRRADLNYFVLAPRYEEPKEAQPEANEGKKKRAGAEALTKLDAVDTTGYDQPKLL